MSEVEEANILEAQNEGMREEIDDEEVSTEKKFFVASSLLLETMFLKFGFCLN